MGKVIDYISLTLVTFLLTFVWAEFVFDSLVLSLICSSAVSLAVIVTARYLMYRYGKPYTYERLALEFQLRGNDYVISTLRKALREADWAQNCIMLSRSLLVAAYKAANLNAADVMNVCTLARRYGYTRAYVIASGIERRAYAVCQLEGVKVVHVKVRQIFTFLAKHNALPNLKPVKNKPSFKMLLETALARSNFKNYAFSGAVLVGVSFLTPLKIYYLCVGSALLLLAILTLTPLGKNSPMAIKLSEELEAAVSKSPIQLCIDDIKQDS